jgi:hypothetical protein
MLGIVDDSLWNYLSHAIYKYLVYAIKINSYSVNFVVNVFLLISRILKLILRDNSLLALGIIPWTKLNICQRNCFSNIELVGMI